MGNSISLKFRKTPLILAAVMSLIVTSCLEKKKEDASQSPSTSPTPTATPVGSIYLTSGTVYVGLGITASSPSQTISRFTTDGEFVSILRDYTTTPGDSPVSILDYDQDNILALVENTAGRRVEVIKKDGSGFANLFSATAVTTQLRLMRYDSSHQILMSRTAAVEKFTGGGIRIPLGTLSYVQNPLGSCATMTNNISSLAIGPDGQILIANAFTAASTNNKVAMIAKTGAAVAGDCLAALAAPTTSHFPTALLMHSSGHLLVGYGNNTGPIHQIYSVQVNAASFGTPVKAFDDVGVLQGISRMAELPSGEVIVASASSAFNTIDRFTFDPATGLLTRVGTAPFISPSIFTRSISDILVVPGDRTY